MADHEQPEKASGEPAATPNEPPKLTEWTEAPKLTEPAAATTGRAEASEPAGPLEAKSELPEVEAPSISPAAPEPAVEPKLEAAIALPGESPVAPTPKARLGFALGPRGKRNAVLAASVALAAALGGALGTLAGGGFGKPTAPATDVASLEQRKAMQQTIAQLSQEIATLKSSVEAANKSSHSQIAKIGERLARERADITGSIAAPRTMPATPAPQAATPTPTPRPPQQMAAIENPPPRHPPVLLGWTLRSARDGIALIESRGEVYQVVPGVPVPGLGRIEDVKREDGRWVVVTPRGIIVSQRDRRYFEAF